MKTAIKEFGEFTFDGRTYTYAEGDTIGSALYRSGVRIFSRSFKYHRPRGLTCMSGACPNCLVKVDGTPNVRACITRVEPGMQATSQNAWPSLTFDVLSINDRLDRLLPVGFYYKTFIRPHFLWPVYETALRRAAGLGSIDTDPERFEEAYYDKQYLHADIAVVGGGPAGMSAALAAAELGARVVLVDENPGLGGHLRYQGPGAGSSRRLAREMAGALHAHAGIEVLTEAAAFGWYEGNLIGVARGKRLIELRAAQVVVATGQIEQPAVFQNNDLPGVFLGSGLQRLMHLYGVRPGERALVATAGDSGWAVAADLLDHQVQVAAVVDARPQAPDTEVAARVHAAGVPVWPSHAIRSARGDRAVRGAVLAQVDEAGDVVSGTDQEVACDLISVSAGFAPNNALLYQAGCTFEYDPAVESSAPAEFAPGIRGVGHAAATQGLEAILLEGQAAGLAAALELPDCESRDARQRWESLREQLDELKAQRRASLRGHAPTNAPAPGKKKFVCLCEDVTEKDLRDAIAEGFDDIETLKRYTTIAMGPCQGKMCSLNALRLCAGETGRSVQQVGVTTSRPPWAPVKLGVLAGRRPEPVRRSPMHHAHGRLGARMMDAGEWKRPEHYGDPAAEVRAVRERVGLIDVSTLGKIEVRGRDAARLLERVYTGTYANLAAGRVRYGLMCNEEGIILDDGLVCRLGEDHYYLTTTSSGANSVFEWLTWWSAAGGWQAHVTNVTAGFGAVNLAGPRARDALSGLVDTDVSRAAFPYMHVRQASVAGVPARLLRVGFVGELGYEIHFPAEYGEHVWGRLMQAGAGFGMAPFGVEAQRVLRLEKKHIIVGQDTDALSDPYAANMGWAVHLEKEDFVGKASLAAAAERDARERLIGFEMGASAGAPAEGEQIVEGGRFIGRVTSARYSPTLGKPIGLAWVLPEWACEGAVIQVRTGKTPAEATVVCRPFYDPAGERLRM